MARQAHDDIEVRGITITKGLRFATMTKTLGAAFTITADMPPIITLDPGGGARQIIMPAENEANRGLTFLIRNGADAAEDLTIRDSANGTTVGSISQNESGLVFLAPAIAGASTLSWVVAMSATT